MLVIFKISVYELHVVKKVQSVARPQFREYKRIRILIEKQLMILRF